MHSLPTVHTKNPTAHQPVSDLEHSTPCRLPAPSWHLHVSAVGQSDHVCSPAFEIAADTEGRGPPKRGCPVPNSYFPAPASMFLGQKCLRSCSALRRLSRHSSLYCLHLANRVGLGRALFAAEVRPPAAWRRAIGYHTSCSRWPPGDELHIRQPDTTTTSVTLATNSFS